MNTRILINNMYYFLKFSSFVNLFLAFFGIYIMGFINLVHSNWWQEILLRFLREDCTDVNIGQKIQESLENFSAENFPKFPASGVTENYRNSVFRHIFSGSKNFRWTNSGGKMDFLRISSLDHSSYPQNLLKACPPIMLNYAPPPPPMLSLAK